MIAYKEFRKREEVPSACYGHLPGVAVGEVRGQGRQGRAGRAGPAGQGRQGRVRVCQLGHVCLKQQLHHDMKRSMAAHQPAAHTQHKRKQCHAPGSKHPTTLAALPPVLQEFEGRGPCAVLGLHGQIVRGIDVL